MSKKIHLIAIVGSAMHNMALSLHEKGFIVSGSDDEINEAFQVPIIRRIEAFIQLALKFTSWPFSDLRPYQTIVWACTVDQHQLLAMQIRKFNPIMLIPSPYLILPALLV